MSSHPNRAKRGVVRLLVADENRMNCQLLIASLRRCRHVKVVAQATRSDEILRQIKVAKPKVALISGGLQDGSLMGFSVIRELRKSHPDLRTILLLDSPDRGWIVDAFRAGAKGVFCRDDSLGSLCRCIQRVHMGQIWASSQQLDTVLEAFARLAPPRLTEGNGNASLSKREQQVAELVAEGLSNRAIAEQLRLSEHTIKNYIFHIFEKLGMSSRVELVLFARALEKGTLDSPKQLFSEMENSSRMGQA